MLKKAVRKTQALIVEVRGMQMGRGVFTLIYCCHGGLLRGVPKHCLIYLNYNELYYKYMWQ